MTYLQLVNKVLRELRESQVTSITTDYALLIGQYVNEAKTEVENAWKWSTLRTNITFTASNGTQTYNLGNGGVGNSATNERSHLLYDVYGRPEVFNLDLKMRMREYPREIVREWQLLNLNPSTVPYPFYQVRDNTGITLVFYPAPNATYNMEAAFWVPQADLVNTTDILSIPSEPVWRRALAMAAGERGGGQGENIAKLEDRAQKSLSDAIMLDMSPEELTAYPW